MRVPLLLALTFVAVSSCDTGPRDFPHAVATFTCGPTDGPATAILLAKDPIPSLEPSYPYVSVVIVQPLSNLPGTVWRIEGSAAQVWAVYRRTPDVLQSASSGSVRIDRVGTDNRVEGTVELRFPSGFVSEEFSAPWVESLVLCG
jgi:hypothetical protein